MNKGTWPTGLHTIAAGRMASYIGPRLETEIKPLIEEVSAREHSWGRYLFLGCIAAAAAVYFGYSIWKPVGHLAVILAAITLFKTFTIYSEKEGALGTAREQLDGVISHDLFQLGLTDVDMHSEDNELAIFNAAGFFGLYDEVHHLQSYGPITQDSYHPLMTHTHLTRTEVEHYTDGNGKRQQRHRIVTVFTGLMLTLDVPGEIDESRILISSRRTQRPRGVFERTTFVGGRKRENKLKSIKTSSLEFNRIYDVEVDDQMEGHEFLDPDRIMRFLNLSTDLSDLFGRGIGLSMLITRGKAYIALETGALVTMSGFSGNAEQMSGQIGAVAAQLSLPHIIAEHLKLTPPPRYIWDEDSPNPQHQENAPQDKQPYDKIV